MQPGSRIGHYEIQSLIGRGGMGEVWKAHDTKLRRDVALKTLSPEFTSDADRLARLEQEAMLLASLSHPNIASIHGLEHDQGAHVLVLELIDGGTLADRLSRGPLPVEQALKIALQIAEALEAAHEGGVVHRDLKPANVAITPEGRVKVLDFGLAKAFGIGGGRALTPAVTALRTEIGSVMGTPAYMSPEQARGEIAGRQADIWAAGAILYEMLTGVSPFARDTTAETLACVLDAQPDFNLLPRATPFNARQLLKRSLEKDPKRRFQHSGDVRIELEDALSTLASGPQTAPVDPAERRRRARRMTALASGLTLVGFLAAYAAWSMGKGAGSSTTAEPVRLAIPSVGTPQAYPVGAQHLALSPDGSRIVYAAEGELSIRRMSDQEIARVGVFDATNPFFSPDGEWVGFQGAQGLLKVPRAGGVPTRLVESNERRAGATWGSDDTIVFATTSGLYRVSAAGGPVSALLRPDAQKGERLYAWPSFLANSRTVLFTIVPADASAATRIAWLDVDSLETQVLPLNGSSARFVPSGHVVYAAGPALMAVQFDPTARVSRGEPVAIRGVTIATAVDNGAAELAVSATGTLAFIEPGTQQGMLSSLTWVDREGREEPLPLQPGAFIYPRVSPDGTRIAVDARVMGNRDIWIWDLRRSTFARLTDGPSEDMMALWTPDSRRVFFASDRTGNIDVYSQPADGSTQARVELATSNAEVPHAFVPDGSAVVVNENFNDIALFNLGRSEAEPLLRRESNDWQTALSPDGRWLAYESNEAGPQMEVFLRPLTDVTSRREKLSIDGGRYALWGPAGSNEIFYVDLDGGMMVVKVETSPDLEIGSAQKLFDTARPPLNISGRPYDISPLDGRFIMPIPVTSLNDQTLNISIVLNWFTELEAQSPAP
jgi:eukaryotic-like serine/threonine-protein kinase